VRQVPDGWHDRPVLLSTKTDEGSEAVGGIVVAEYGDEEYEDRC
jgi:hypothetical protein